MFQFVWECVFARLNVVVVLFVWRYYVIYHTKRRRKKNEHKLVCGVDKQPNNAKRFLQLLQTALMRVADAFRALINLWMN